jgi:low affinity Fe/Cu permease
MFVNVFWMVFFVFGLQKELWCDTKNIKIKIVLSVLRLTLFANNFVLTIENKRQKTKN